MNEAYPERMLVEAREVEKIKCDTCNRELRTSLEWVRSGNGIMCETCYQNLLSPNMKINFLD